MNPCDECAIRTLRYLDNDLQGAELEYFRRHLESCTKCRTHLEREEALSRLLRRTSPLYSAPESLREGVCAGAAEVLAEAPGANQFYRRVSRGLATQLKVAAQLISARRAIVTAMVAIALCLAVVPDIVRNVRAANYVESAVGAHRMCLDGQLAPALQSSSPQAVTAWFAGKVPFDFRLPAAESAPDEKPAYQLTGANLVSYKGSLAALVTYKTAKEKITLLATANAPVTGGVEVRFGKLTFHYRTNSGFRVITWRNHDLSYALVSSVSGPPEASCLVCHQHMADRGSFKR